MKTGPVWLLAGALTLLPISSVEGQAFVRVSAGGTLGTRLLGEVIGEPISLRPAMSPTGVLLLGWSFSNGYRLGVEARYARSALEVHDQAAGSADDLGTLTTTQLALVADGRLSGDLRWEAIAGALHYSPEVASGVFRDGAPTPLLLGGGITWRHPIGSALRVVVGGRYDYHAFQTPRLEAQGYSGTQAVHRGSLTIGLERGF